MKISETKKCEICGEEYKVYSDEFCDILLYGSLPCIIILSIVICAVLDIFIKPGWH